MRTEDGNIVYKCLNGDSAAFGFLVGKYKESVYAFAYDRLHNFHDAEDVVQEVFFKAYRKLRTLKRWDSFASWLYRMTANLCKDWIRNQSRRPDHEFTADKAPGVLENHSMEFYREGLARESIHEALNSLPEVYRQVITLTYFGGMTSMEIARFTGASPAAIRMRLSKARSLLREEMLDMMKTTFEVHRLRAGFTFHIVEAVKKIRIQPTPRTAGLPWGLSLAAGIILSILSLGPQLSVFSRVSAATGSPLTAETKVLEVGEIPVDVVKISDISFPASKRNQGDSVGSDLPYPQETTLMAADPGGDTLAREASTGENIIIDPETGVKYTRIKALVGKSDVIKYATVVSLSPNGKFLLWHKLVVPLDGGEPFDLVDMPALRCAWSPDGQKVCFYSGGAIWVIPVSPETGRSTGVAKKLLDGRYKFQEPPSWSPDSERIVFQRNDEENLGNICSLSVKDGTLTQITDDLDSVGFAVWSPDGKTIAYSTYSKTCEVRLIPAEGGTYKKISDFNEYFAHPISWSPDGEWLICKSKYSSSEEMETHFRLLHMDDGREVNISTPLKEIGWFFSSSPDREKLLFYRPSYDCTTAFKVVSAFCGSSWRLGMQHTLWPHEQFWSPDSSMIVIPGKNKDGAEGWYGLWVVPLSGSDPYPLRLYVSVAGEPAPWWYPSPDCKTLLFSIERSDDKMDLWVVPISLKDGQTVGSAVEVFSGSGWAVWSPDGKKLAVFSGKDLWIASIEGGEPVQLTDTPGDESDPVWSPDGEMIAYTYETESKKTLMVISASGGEAMKILDKSGDKRQYTWSPDSKELAFVSKGIISAISIADGIRRQILDPKELGMDEVGWLRWSPDGQYLAFLSDWSQIWLVPAEGGAVTELAVDDPGEKYGLFWSPDGRWISYQAEEFIKIRPEGEIWEVNVSELLGITQKE